MPENSHPFIGQPYPRGTGNLQIGDQVRIHPLSQTHADPYDATIVLYKENVCLDVPDGVFKAPITSKLFSRLEKL